MAKVINCDCGSVVQADSDDQLVAEAQTHARNAHGMEITREQVLALALTLSRVDARRRQWPPRLLKGRRGS